MVYIRVDDAGRVVDINSSAFLEDTEGWKPLGSGYGDRYRHAQGNYLPGPLVDARGVYRYKLENGFVVERTAEEMDEDYTPPAPQTTYDKRLTELEEAIDLLLTGVTE